MAPKYLHTMVRVKDLEKTMDFFRLLGLEETIRAADEAGLALWARPAAAP